MIPGYQCGEKIYESVNSIAIRARRESDGEAVVLKIHRMAQSNPGEILRYKREFDILRRLVGLGGVARAFAMESVGNAPVLVMEDCGADSLKSTLKKRALPLEEALVVAVRVLEALDQVHGARVIHKDINPGNILYDPQSGKIKIIDFGISTLQPKENPVYKNTEFLEGTPAYISPEQTARMNRLVDYRTDYYSFGVMLYEMLTQRLPFVGESVDALILSHLVQKPALPSELNPQVPAALSDIVLKLMAKTPEDRYQSVRGIVADLNECQRQLREKGRVDPFPIATKDFTQRLILPQQLYGRDREVLALRERLEKVSQGGRELVLVSGSSGIGKTTLVKELYKPLSVQHGQFISGKFDPLQRNRPYSALVDAFRQLLRQLLSATEERLQGWQRKLTQALGPNLRVISEVLPEIDFIVGPSPEVPELPAGERQNRFNRVFISFISVFAQKEHPLVIFIDDLQWADAASLKMLLLALTSPEIKGLFFIGAYRDNEVGPGHPLLLTMEELRKVEVAIHRLSLCPLGIEHVTQLIADTLRTPLPDTEPLARLILQKTDGNPFFIGEFLTSLHAQGLLSMEPLTGVWTWDLQRIQSFGITENVVDLMLGRIAKLDVGCQALVRLSACLGSPFDLASLAIAGEKSPVETHEALMPAIEEGLLIPLGDLYHLDDGPQGKGARGSSPMEYKFAHDRIQQAAYEMIPRSERPGLHLAIGRRLLQKLPLERLEEKRFDITNHWSLGAEVLTDQADQDLLAQMSLDAGQKAKLSAAFDSALRYFASGVRLLGPDGWTRCYAVSLALHEGAAEAASLTSDYEEAARYIHAVLQHGSTVLDKVQTYYVQVASHIAQNNLEKAQDGGLDAMGQLGMRFPRKPRTTDVLLALLRTRLAFLGKSDERLIDLPPMTDPIQLALIKMFISVQPCTYVINPYLMVLTIMKQAQFTVRFGHSSMAAFAYASYGSILCRLGSLGMGFRMARLARALMDRCENREHQSKTYFAIYGFVWHWGEHVRSTFQPLLEGYQVGLETGDLEYAALNAHLYCHNAFFAGKELVDLDPELTQYRDIMSQYRQEMPLTFNRIHQQCAQNLMGQVEDVCELCGQVYDEAAMMPIHRHKNDMTAQFEVHYFKLFLGFLFRKYQQAVEHGDGARVFEDNITGVIVLTRFRFYDSLARLALIPTLDRTRRNAYLKVVRQNRKKLKKWARHAPMNNLHLLYLVDAEIHRLADRKDRARVCYEKAIQLAKKHQYLNDEAVATELAANFYLVTRKREMAKELYRSAYFLYSKWGAWAKVRDLEARFPEYFQQSSGVL